MNPRGHGVGLVEGAGDVGVTDGNGDDGTGDGTGEGAVDGPYGTSW